MFNNQLATNNTKEAVQISGYQVNSQGYIFLPSIGEVYVLGSMINLDNEIGRLSSYNLYKNSCF